jgi:hypothetical protein
MYKYFVSLSCQVKRERDKRERERGVLERGRERESDRKRGVSKKTGVRQR